MSLGRPAEAELIAIRSPRSKASGAFAAIAGAASPSRALLARGAAGREGAERETEEFVIGAHAWNEQLDLGNEDLDHEHHLQIALVSALADAIEQSRPGEARRLAGQLVAYSGMHFGSEELIMTTSSYPDRQRHLEEHRVLSQAMLEVEGALERDERELALAFALDVRAGLAGHIAGSDHALADHVRATPVHPRARS
jgi:hemerythrin-like metal-binding protein